MRGKESKGRALRAAGAAWRAALALALAAAMCCPAAAFAADGSLTVNARDNEGATYYAYCAFTADVSEDGKATGVEWPDASAKSAVLGYLAESGYGEWLEQRGWTYDGADEVAENAAVFCTEKIRSSADVAAGGSPRAKAAGTFAAGLATALARGIATPAALSAGEAAELPQGYYMVRTQPSSLSDGEAGTSPVWVAVGSSTVVTEKTALPAVVAEVRSSDAAAFARATDALCGQQVEHRVTVTLPSNLDAFPSYAVRLEARLARMGSYAAGSAAVEIDGTDVTAALAEGGGGRVSGGGSVVLTIDDVTDGTWGASAGSTVVLRFKTAMETAPNGPAAGQSDPWGECTATLRYPCDPAYPGSVAAMGSSSRVYEFAALVSVTDDATGMPATEATYTVQVLECADASLVGKYLSGDGTLYDSARLAKNSSTRPVLGFYGLAAGKYRIRQTGMTAGYPAQDADIVLEVAPEYDALGGLSELKATASGGYAASSFGSIGTQVTGADAELGTVSVDSRVTRVMAMPLTGLPADGAPRIAAAALGTAGALACALGLARRRRAAKGERSRS